jgi:hypothetical protein
MSTFEEKAVTSLQSLFAKVDTLARINIRDILKPDVYYDYEKTIQEAYDALTTFEDALTTLGIKLEYQHWRLGGAVDELKPLMPLRTTLKQQPTAIQEDIWADYDAGKVRSALAQSANILAGVNRVTLLTDVRNERSQENPYRPF